MTVLDLRIRPPVRFGQVSSSGLSSLYERWLPSWTKQAACAERDTEDWFPEERKTDEERRNGAYLAKQVCWTCSVLTDCLRQSLVMDDHFGVFGGTTGKEREATAGLPLTERLDVLLIEVSAQQLWGQREKVPA